MMPLRRLHNACLLRPEDVAPSRPDFQVLGVFNPGAVEVGDDVLLMARVAEAPAEEREGGVALPRWDPGEGLVADRLPVDAVEPEDPRVVLVKAERRLRLTSVSHLRVYRCPGGREVAEEVGRFVPGAEWEQYGVEDPRIVSMEGRFYFTYVAVSEHGAGTALASTEDFVTFERHGIIFPPENKDVALFPERIGGDYVALHRPNPRMHFSAPGMWLARSPDLTHWGGHEPLHAGTAPWETGRIGAGPPPIATERGWLEVYHGMALAREPGVVGTYSAGLLLLDREDPGKVLYRAEEPILTPEADFEREGFVPSVVFPTGIVRRDDVLQLYYGAADTVVGMVEVSLDAVMSSVN